MLSFLMACTCKYFKQLIRLKIDEFFAINYLKEKNEQFIMKLKTQTARLQKNTSAVQETISAEWRPK